MTDQELRNLFLYPDVYFYPEGEKSPVISGEFLKSLARELLGAREIIAGLARELVRLTEENSRRII